jgi:hypothetical protein
LLTSQVKGVGEWGSGGVGEWRRGSNTYKKTGGLFLPVCIGESPYHKGHDVIVLEK